MAEKDFISRKSIFNEKATVGTVNRRLLGAGEEAGESQETDVIDQNLIPPFDMTVVSETVSVAADGTTTVDVVIEWGDLGEEFEYEIQVGEEVE